MTNGNFTNNYRYNIMNPVIDYITHVKYGLDDLYTTKGILIGPKNVEIAESINPCDYCGHHFLLRLFLLDCILE